MRAFYDEVERIGVKVGTVRQGNGLYTVATNNLQTQDSKINDYST
jgi:hypothetical protein